MHNGMAPLQKKKSVKLAYLLRCDNEVQICEIFQCVKFFGGCMLKSLCGLTQTRLCGESVWLKSKFVSSFTFVMSGHVSICPSVRMYHCSSHLISTKIYTGDFCYENVSKFWMFVKIVEKKKNVGHFAGRPKYRVHVNYQRILQNHIFTNTEQKYMMLLPSERGMFAVS